MKREQKTILCSFIFIAIAGIWYLLKGAGGTVEENFIPYEAVVTEEAFHSNRENMEPEKQKKICCHICGAVKNQGVYECAEGARLVELIEKAGGFTREAASSCLNLARVVSDGEQIYVPTCQEEKKKEERTGSIENDKKESMQESVEDKVNINTADIDKLISLPGIGQAKAKMICAYRDEHGAFQSIEELKNVEGIKDGVYNKVKDLIAVQ